MEYRPTFHFSTLENWLNDPNGLIYFDGEYHLFYQYHPFSTKWGPMHWGHAVSKDLVKWEYLPIALYPDTNGFCFSGSAVIDKDNTSGLFDGKPGMIAMYTSAKTEHEHGEVLQTQSIAYSKDKGRTFEYYKGNPVIENPGINNFRDPKVFWYEEQQKWVVVIASDINIDFYESKDLLNWNKMSSFGADVGIHSDPWECPEFLRFDINGKTVWILKVCIQSGAPSGRSGEIYFVGEFNGYEFTEFKHNNYKMLDDGKDFYASQLWSNTLNDRKITIGWMTNFDYSGEIPTGDNWRGLMTIPREMGLLESVGDFYLTQYPVDELKKYRSETKKLEAFSVGKNSEETIELFDAPQEIDMNIYSDNVSEVVISIGNIKSEHFDLILNKNEQKIIIRRDKSGIVDFNQNFEKSYECDYNFQTNTKIKVLIDKCVVEVFLDNGKKVLSNLVFPSQQFNQLKIKTDAEIKITEYFNFHINLS